MMTLFNFTPTNLKYSWGAGTNLTHIHARTYSYIYARRVRTFTSAGVGNTLYSRSMRHLVDLLNQIVIFLLIMLSVQFLQIYLLQIFKSKTILKLRDFALIGLTNAYLIHIIIFVLWVIWSCFCEFRLL